MELLEGETVQALIERWKIIPITDTIDCLVQICSGLVYAHRQGIIHGNIKPSNLFLSRDGGLKLLDFGLGFPPEDKGLDLSGTAAYMSPEQINGNEPDGRSDIYALGIIAYEMVTGKKPFAADNQRDIRDTRLNQNIPDPAGRVPGLPEILRRFILKACFKNRDERYQSAASALKDLRVLAKAYGLDRETKLSEKRKMATLVLLYPEEHKLALKRLLEEFSAKTQNLGIDLKAPDFKDI